MMYFITPLAQLIKNFEQFSKRWQQYLLYVYFVFAFAFNKIWNWKSEGGST